MSPGELHRATFAAWRTVVSRLVAAAPVVLVLEDLHWADPTSLRLTLDLAGLAAFHFVSSAADPGHRPARGRPGAGPPRRPPGWSSSRSGGAAEEELARVADG